MFLNKVPKHDKSKLALSLAQLSPSLFEIFSLRNWRYIFGTAHLQHVINFVYGNYDRKVIMKQLQCRNRPNKQIIGF